MRERLDWDTDGAAWPHRGASRFVAAGGLRWHVQVQGQGPALWLLHGTGASGHSWRALPPRLAGRCTLVVPDLPGHGFSGPLPQRQQSLPGMAAALAQLAQALALPPRLVAGHSAGAALAVRAVLDGGWTPAALVGVNAALLPFGHTVGQSLRPGGAAPPGNGFGALAAPAIGGLAQRVARGLARSGWVNRALARRAGERTAVQRLVDSTGSRLDADGLALYATLLRSPAHLAGALAMMGDWDLDTLWRDLPRLRVPLTLLAAAGDTTVPPAQADAAARHCPRVTVQHRPALGHLAHEEDPDWVAGVLQRLLDAPADASKAVARSAA